jgi:hypothetical protein
MKDKYDQKLREHGDMGRIIRQAQIDLAERRRIDARKAEIDGKDAPEVLDAPVLAVEDANGFWTVGTTTSIYPSQSRPIEITDRSERMALVELRYAIKEQMVHDRHCSPEKARRLAALMNLWVAGRVPHNRIVSR